MQSKNILTSKTLWANVIGLGAAYLGSKGIGVSGETQAQIVTGVLAVVNIILRLVTNKPVHIVKRD